MIAIVDFLVPLLYPPSARKGRVYVRIIRVKPAYKIARRFRMKEDVCYSEMETELTDYMYVMACRSARTVEINFGCRNITVIPCDLYKTKLETKLLRIINCITSENQVKTLGEID